MVCKELLRENTPTRQIMEWGLEHRLRKRRRRGRRIRFLSFAHFSEPGVNFRGCVPWVATRARGRLEVIEQQNLFKIMIVLAVLVMPQSTLLAFDRGDALLRFGLQVMLRGHLFHS